MFFSSFPKKDEVTVVIERHFPKATMGEVFPSPEYDKFLDYVLNSKNAAAAKEYVNINGKELAQATLAIKIAQGLLDRT